MTDWLEHTVQVDVAVPVGLAWDLWSDLEKMPNWMKWIHAVKIAEDNPDLSEWTLAATGFEFKWRSRIVQLNPQQLIQWEAIDGLPNRGAIRFYDRKDDTSIVKLTVAYGIPGVIGKLMDNLFLGRLVESTLQKDLNRFRRYAEKAYQAQQP